jgi:RimK family alpha-L-glutamate ligase
MKCIIVVNQFLNSGKFNEIYDYLLNAALKHGISAEIRTNAELLMLDGKCACPLDDIDFVIFWDKDIPLAKQLEKLGLRLYNRADAIQACDDKSLTYLKLLGTGIKMPKTIVLPMTYPNIGYTDTDFLALAENKLGYPFVAKESFGSFGAQVYLIKNREEAQTLLKSKPMSMIFQEYISESTGRDIRINMVGNECVAAMMRYNDNDFRANITNGGSMKKYTPTTDEIAIAQKVVKILNLDFGGIDILFGRDEPILCEVNSNAHFKNIFDCTGVNAAEKIFEYILEDMK